MRAGRWVRACAVAASIAAANLAHADDARRIESRDIFGFTVGSGVGEVGETELELDTQASFGKRDGRYAAADSSLSLEWTPNRRVQLAFGPFLSVHAISGVGGLDDRQQIAVGGVGAGLLYLLVERGTESPVGITVSAEPQWRRVDEIGGARVDNLGVEFRLNADAALVRDKALVAANLLYAPEGTRDPAGVGAGWAMESTAGVSAAVAVQVLPTVFVGAELWYLRHANGAWLTDVTGDALLAGPTLSVRLSPDVVLAAAWNAQLAGREAGNPGAALDLADFPRHRARLKLLVAF